MSEAALLSPASGAAERSAEPPAFELIELFFFAYRDFVGDADRVLAEYGFGRAHHRVLHFVTRRPGLPVNELLDLLRITKQSLNRVLKELIDREFVVQRTGRTDRRQRLLCPTPAGRELAFRLARLQSRRIERALEGQDRAEAEQFLFGMIDPAERAKVQGGPSGAKTGG